MPRTVRDAPELKQCSFCGRDQRETPLVNGPSAFICGSCAQLAVDILDLKHDPSMKVADLVKRAKLSPDTVTVQVLVEAWLRTMARKRGKSKKATTK